MKLSSILLSCIASALFIYGCSSGDWGSDPAGSATVTKTIKLSFYRNYEHIYGEPSLNDSLIEVHRYMADSLASSRAEIDPGLEVRSIWVNDTSMIRDIGYDINYSANPGTSASHYITRIKTIDKDIRDTLPGDFTFLRILQPSFMQSVSSGNPIVIKWEPSDFEDDRIYVSVHVFTSLYYPFGPSFSISPGFINGIDDDGYFSLDMSEAEQYLNGKEIIFARVVMLRKGVINKINNGVRFSYNLESRAVVDFRFNN